MLKIPYRRAVPLVFLVVTPGCIFGRSEPSPTPVAIPKGGSLNVALTEPAAIDPAKASDRSGYLILKQICEPLVAANSETGALTPGAAESWTVSPDAKKVTFILRSGMKFHNGRDVTAQDYVYSLSRFVHKDGSQQRFWLDKVAGYKEAAEGGAETLSGAKAIDAKTLEIELGEPFAELPAVLSHPAAGSAVPKEEVDKGAEPFGLNPVCTGPYKMKAPWVKGQEIALVKSTDYVGPDDGFLDEITFRIGPDTEAGYRALTERTVDIAEIPITDKLTEARRVKGRVSSGTNGLIAYVGFPVRKPLYDNVEFRKALSLAVDREKIVEGLLAGSRLIPKGPLPPNAGPISKELTCAKEMKRAADQEGSRAALGASGIDPAATKPTIYFNLGGGHEVWLQNVADSWKQTLGLETGLSGEEFKTYLDHLAEGTKDGPFRLAWAVDYPSPEAFFGPILVGGSLDNFTGFQNQSFDELIKQARATPQETVRRAIYVKAGEVICREFPLIVMWFGVNHYAFSPQVMDAGARVDVFGDPMLRELGVSRKSPA